VGESPRLSWLRREERQAKARHVAAQPSRNPTSPPPSPRRSARRACVLTRSARLNEPDHVARADGDVVDGDVDVLDTTGDWGQYSVGGGRREIRWVARKGGADFSAMR
jgi:hypothetical protein